MEKSNRRQLAIETSLVMFLCSAGLACIQVFRGHAVGTDYVVMVGIPAAAACLFVGIANFTSHLLNTDRMQFPYTLTLPFVFCALLPVCSLIVSTPDKALVATDDTMVYAHLWQQPVELAVVLFVEVLALNFYSLLPRLTP